MRTLVILLAVGLLATFGCDRKGPVVIVEPRRAEAEGAKNALDAEKVEKHPSEEGAGPYRQDEPLVRKMKDALRAKIRPGTPVADARRRMEQDGFRCELLRNRAFSEQGWSHEGMDYLYCDRTDGGFPILRRWQVAVVVREGVAVDILVSTGLTGY